MVGEYTYNVKTISNVIKNTEYVTSDGECIILDERVSEHIAMDIENMKEQQSIKIGNGEYVKNRTELGKLIKKNGGGFIFNHYKNLDSNKHMFRFIYLCTKLDYDNYLVLGNSKNNLMTRDDLYEVLNLKRKESTETIKFLEKNGFLIMEGEYIKVNNTICKRGSIGKKKDVTRIFDNAIEKIYKDSQAKYHKKLGLLIKMLPLIHFNKNIICEDPTEEHIALIKPLSLTSLSKELGYSTPQRLKSGLMSLKVKEEPVIMLSNINGKDLILVNPKVFYKGVKVTELQFLIDLFDISKNT